MENAKRIVVWAVVLLVLVSSGTVFADTAGYVQFVSGDVQLTTAAGQAHGLKKGEAVNEGDTLSSAKSSTAQIKMQDGGLIAVRPETRLTFDSFKYRGKEDGSEQSFFSLLKGGFRAVTGLIGRTNKSSYRITTPAATIGIRGTDHETFVVVPGSTLAAVASVGTYNKVNLGETSLTTDKGTLFVLPNQMGFAGGRDQQPQLQPLNINIFTAAPSPSPQAQHEEGTVRDTAVVDTAAGKTAESNAVNAAGTTDTSVPPSIVPPTVVVTPPATPAANPNLLGGDGVRLSSTTGLQGIVTFEVVTPSGTPYLPPLPLPPGYTYNFNPAGMTGFDCIEGCNWSIGTAQILDAGWDGGVVHWGRWANGNINVGGTVGGLYFGPDQGLHFLVGIPTSISQLMQLQSLTNGVIPATNGNIIGTYNLIGGTSPTPSDGVGGGLGVGHLISGTVAANFTNLTVNGNLLMGFNGNSIYQSTYSGPMGSMIYGGTGGTGGGVAGVTTFQGGSINVCGTAGCATHFYGQFFGNYASHLGVGYTITANQPFYINGVAVYRR